MEKRNASVEARGRNVEEAIEDGLEQLRLSREQVEIEILSRGSRGVLGLGAEDARVRITPLARPAEAPAAAVKQPPPAPQPKPVAKPAPARAPAIVDEDDEESYADGDLAGDDRAGEYGRADEDDRADEGADADVSRAELEQIAVNALKNLLEHMSVKARVVLKEPTGFMSEGDNPPPVVLDIQGDDLGILIGRRAETLSALQYIIRLIVNHQTHRWYNVIVDIEGYKERRENQLSRLAERMVEQVLSTQKPVVLEAMPPYERRIVHLTLRDHPQVETHSIGEGENRKVMIHLRQ
jgi:spoIIIJ-associated protein